MIPLRIVHFEPNSIMRSPFSAGLHADGLSLSATRDPLQRITLVFLQSLLVLKAAANYSRFHLHLHKTQPGTR